MRTDMTPMNERALTDVEYRRTLEAAIPLGRAGTPEEVAGLAMWLASPAAACPSSGHLAQLAA